MKLFIVDEGGFDGMEGEDGLHDRGGAAGHQRSLVTILQPFRTAIARSPMLRNRAWERTTAFSFRATSVAGGDALEWRGHSPASALIAPVGEPKGDERSWVRTE